MSINASTAGVSGAVITFSASEQHRYSDMRAITVNSIRSTSSRTGNKLYAVNHRYNYQVPDTSHAIYKDEDTLNNGCMLYHKTRYDILTLD